VFEQGLGGLTPAGSALLDRDALAAATQTLVLAYMTLATCELRTPANGCVDAQADVDRANVAWTAKEQALRVGLHVPANG